MMICLAQPSYMKKQNFLYEETEFLYEETELEKYNVDTVDKEFTQMKNRTIWTTSIKKKKKP